MWRRFISWLDAHRQLVAVEKELEKEKALNSDHLEKIVSLEARLEAEAAINRNREDILVSRLFEHKDLRPVRPRPVALIESEPEEEEELDIPEEVKYIAEQMRENATINGAPRVPELSEYIQHIMDNPREYGLQ